MGDKGPSPDNAKRNGKNGRGRGKGRPFLPGNPGGPGGPRKLRITDHLHDLADEVMDNEETRGKALARALFADSLDRGVPALVKNHARTCVLERIDPPPQDAATVPVVPLDVTIYKTTTVNLLQELSDETHGCPTTEDVLRKIRSLPLLEDVDDENC